VGSLQGLRYLSGRVKRIPLATPPPGTRHWGVGTGGMVGVGYLLPLVCGPVSVAQRRRSPPVQPEHRGSRLVEQRAHSARLQEHNGAIVFRCDDNLAGCSI